MPVPPLCRFPHQGTPRACPAAPARLSLSLSVCLSPTPNRSRRRGATHLDGGLDRVRLADHEFEGRVQVRELMEIIQHERPGVRVMDSLRKTSRQWFTRWTQNVIGSAVVSGCEGEERCGYLRPRRTKASSAETSGTARCRGSAPSTANRYDQEGVLLAARLATSLPPLTRRPPRHRGDGGDGGGGATVGRVGHGGGAAETPHLVPADVEPVLQHRMVSCAMFFVSWLRHAMVARGLDPTCMKGRVIRRVQQRWCLVQQAAARWCQ